ncbi:MAG: response regulator transcription factor, partial [Acidimicrobiales bacterium]
SGGADQAGLTSRPRPERPPGPTVSGVKRPAAATAVIVDEWPLVRLGMVQALRQAQVTVVAAVAEGDEGVRRVLAHGASTLLLGAHRDLAVAESVRRAKALAVPPRVVVLLDQIGRPQLEALRAVGVDALLSRSIGPEELAAALARVAAGERVVAPVLLPLLFEVLGPRGGEPGVGGGAAGDVGLTRKELEVLARMGEGRSNREIAEALFVTPATVKTHLGHIYAKLGVATRQEAMARAVALGLLG